MTLTPATEDEPISAAPRAPLGAGAMPEHTTLRLVHDLPKDLAPAQDQRRRIAFVLQGGGSVAAPQVGMLRALTEAGIVPDIVVGSSSGALNAVAYASDPTLGGVDRLEELWLSLRRKHVAPLSARIVLAALAGRNDALLANRALREVLRLASVPSDLADCTIPAYVVATDLEDGVPVILSRGSTVDALLASSAFPGLYPPVQVAGRQLIDGGVCADIPILQAELLGASVSFVLSAAVADKPDAIPHGPIALMYRALGQLLDAASRRDLALAAGVVHEMPASVTHAMTPLDFRETRALIESGYQLATQWLATHHVAAHA